MGVGRKTLEGFGTENNVSKYWMMRGHRLQLCSSLEKLAPGSKGFQTYKVLFPKGSEDLAHSIQLNKECENGDSKQCNNGL